MLDFGILIAVPLWRISGNGIIPALNVILQFVKKRLEIE